MKIVSLNPGETLDPTRAARELKNLSPDDVDVYCVQECRGARRDYIQTFGEDYRVLMSSGRGASMITMVHRDHRIVNERYLHMTMEWTGPKLGRVQPPRIHNITDIEGGWRIINLHRVWCPHSGARGRNGPAFLEEHARLVRVGRRPGSKRRTTLFVGDQNSTVYDVRPGSPRRMADRLDAQIIATGGAVDWAYVMNGGGHGGRHPYPAGDGHPLVVIRAEKRK